MKTQEEGSKEKVIDEWEQCPICKGKNVKVDTTYGNLESDDLNGYTLICRNCKKVFMRFQTVTLTNWEYIPEEDYDDWSSMMED